MSIILGIDPGKDGGLVLVDEEGKVIEKFPVPFFEIKRSKKKGKKQASKKEAGVLKFKRNVMHAGTIFKIGDELPADHKDFKLLKQFT